MTLILNRNSSPNSLFLATLTNWPSNGCSIQFWNTFSSKKIRGKSAQRIILLQLITFSVTMINPTPPEMLVHDKLTPPASPPSKAQGEGHCESKVSCPRSTWSLSWRNNLPTTNSSTLSSNYPTVIFGQLNWYTKVIGKLTMTSWPVMVSWLNPLTPRSDWHVTSPYNIETLSSKQVMRIFKLIR